MDQGKPKPEVTQHEVRPEWLVIANRLQHAANFDSLGNFKNKRMAIITINILVDASGVPKFWTEPKVTRIEPNYKKDEILSFLTKDLLND